MYQTMYERKPTQDWFHDVYQFHEAMNCHASPFPGVPDDNTVMLRWSLIVEELKELQKAMETEDLPAVADAIGDAIYVLIGTALAYGIDLRPVWDAIQQANMAKKDGPVREDGKRLKPPDWRPPDIKGILMKQVLKCFFQKHPL